MSYQKIRPCPKCGRPGEELDVYSYDSGTRHVECLGCNYMGPGEGTIGQAIQSHNELVREIAIFPSEAKIGVAR